MGRSGSAIAAWLAERAQPREQLVTWVVLGYRKPPDHVAPDSMSEYVARCAVAASDQVLPTQQTGFAAVTDRRALVGSQGGMFGFKPKHLELEGPLDTFRVEWFDQRRSVADERHLLFRFGDHRWMRRSAMVHERRNADQFIAALGARRQHLAIGRSSRPTMGLSTATEVTDPSGARRATCGERVDEFRRAR